MKTSFNLFFYTLIIILFVSCEGDKNISALLLNNYDITVELGRSVPVNIIQGNGDYTVQSNNKSIADAELTGNVILIKGNSKGVTYILVKDKEKETAIISINVEQKKEVLLSNLHVMLVPDMKHTVEILQGSIQYDLISSDNNVVKVINKADKNFTIQGCGVGKATITVVDTEDEERNISIKVAVMENSPLSERAEYTIANPGHPQNLPSSVMGITFLRHITSGHIVYSANHVQIERSSEFSAIKSRQDLCLEYNKKEKYTTFEFEFDLYNRMPPFIVNDNETLRLINYTGFSGGIKDGNYYSELRIIERH